MAEHIFAVVNPFSSRGTTGDKWKDIYKKLKQSGLDVEAAFTAGIADATSMARKALQSGYTQILAVGGDGTVNEVVNGFFDGSGQPINPGASLGIIARGTGCDFIRSLGIPHNEDKAVAVIARNKKRRIDIGLCEFTKHDGSKTSRFFANIADLGIGGATVKRVNESPKTMGGFLTFLAGSLSTILSYKNQELDIILDDTKHLKMKSNAVIVANGNYFGGGMRIAPNALLDDGQFQVVILGDLSKGEILANFIRVYLGTHLKHPKVLSFSAQRVRVASKEDCLLDLDGEQPGRSEAVFSLIPKGIQVII